jgi:hypothetical protein
MQNPEKARYVRVRRNALKMVGRKPLPSEIAGEILRRNCRVCMQKDSVRGEN